MIKYEKIVFNVKLLNNNKAQIKEDIKTFLEGALKHLN